LSATAPPKKYECCYEAPQVWKVNFEAYCKELRQHFKWVQYLLVAYNKYAELPRVDYLKDLNALRYQSLDEGILHEQMMYESKVINLE
jgi:hypothetical protein